MRRLVPFLRSLDTFLGRPSNLLVVALIAYALRVILAFSNRGYYHPDEFFNYLETAFQWAYPDFVHHLDTSVDLSYRSLFIVGWHFLILKGMRALDIFSPALAEGLLKWVMVTLHMGVIFAAYKTTILYKSKACGRFVAVFMLFWYYFIYFSPHFLSENYAALFMMVAFWHLAAYEAKPAKWSLLWFGLCVAIATQLRLQMAFFLIVPFGMLLARRRSIDALALATGFWLPTLVLGLLEAYYRGAAFATFRAYYDINLGTGALILANASPWYQFFLSYNIQFCEWFFPLFLGFAVVGFTRHMPLAGGAVLGYFVCHCLFPHKEIRFLFPMTPLLVIAFVIGLTSWYQQSSYSRRRKDALLALTLFSLLSAQVFKCLHTPWRGDISGEACTLLSAAGRQRQGEHIIQLGRGLHCGYFSLAVDLPLSRFELTGTGGLPINLDLSAYNKHAVIIDQSLLTQLEAIALAQGYGLMEGGLTTPHLALVSLARNQVTR